MGGCGGLFYGGLQTVLEGAAGGNLRQPGFAAYTLRQAGATGKEFGKFSAIYSGTNCYLTSIRGGGKSDFVNIGISGFTAGAVSSLKSRNPRQILLSGLASGVITVILFGMR